VSDLRRQNEKKAAIFKNKYNRSFDYGNNYIRSMAQKGNDLLIRNQNLMERKAVNSQQPKPTKIREVTPQNPYTKSTQRLAANHQEANIFQTVTEATTRGVNNSVVSGTGGQITFNQATGNGKSLESAGGRTGKRCIFMTGSEFEGITVVGEGGELVKDEGESVVTGNDLRGKDDSA
jgi:hypothetical protein